MGKTVLEQLSVSARAVIEAVTRDYQLDKHGDVRAEHIEHLSDEFVSRFAIVGTPTQCVDRLGELLDNVPLSRIVVMSNSRGVDPAVLGGIRRGQRGGVTCRSRAVLRGVDVHASTSKSAFEKPRA